MSDICAFCDCNRLVTLDGARFCSWDCYMNHRENNKNQSASSVLDAIIKYKREHNGNSPTLRELCQITNTSGVRLMKFYLDALEEQGKISKKSNKSRAIEVMNSEWIYHGGDDRNRT